MSPRESPFTLQENERVLGRWKAHYLPPAGGNFLGQLQVSDRRVFFVAKVESARLQPMIVGPVDSVMVAYALDLDTSHVTYEESLLRIVIPKSEIEQVIPIRQFLNHCVSLTLKNNGSIHLFDTGIIPATTLIRVITE